MLEAPISKLSSSSAEAAPTPLPSTSVISGIVPNSNSGPFYLQFYTPPVCDIIEHAKQISHCNIASINSFPLHADFNHKSSEYMNQVIAKCWSHSLSIPDGRYWLLTGIKSNVCNGSQMVVAFFYTGSNAITSIFPEVFKKEVLHTAAVLTVTAVIFKYPSLFTCWVIHRLKLPWTRWLWRVMRWP